MNKYLVLKSSLKNEALLWLENIGRFLAKDDTKRYEESVFKLQKAFREVNDKSALQREFYCQQQDNFESASKFYLRKLDLKNKIGLDLSFYELLDIIVPLFTVQIQNYIEL